MQYRKEQQCLVEVYEHVMKPINALKNTLLREKEKRTRNNKVSLLKELEYLMYTKSIKKL